MACCLKIYLYCNVLLFLLCKSFEIKGSHFGFVVELPCCICQINTIEPTPRCGRRLLGVWPCTLNHAWSKSRLSFPNSLWFITQFLYQLLFKLRSFSLLASRVCKKLKQCTRVTHASLGIVATTTSCKNVSLIWSHNQLTCVNLIQPPIEISEEDLNHSNI